MENYFSQIEEETDEELEVILQQVSLANQFLDNHLLQLEEKRILAEAEISSLKHDNDLILQATDQLREDNLLLGLLSERLDQEIDSLIRHVELHCLNNFPKSE
jgi:chorismate mutase